MKKFYDVFPTVNLKDDVHDIFSQVEIERVLSNKSRTQIKIFICSNHLIEKKLIFYAEDMIAKQLFQNQNMEIHIVERFQLSEQYHAKKIYELYKDSILQELKSYHVLLFSIFHQAKIEFSDEHTMKMTVGESVVVKKKMDELIDILYRVFRERCNVEFDLKYDYYEVDHSKIEDEKQRMLKRQVQKIMSTHIDKNETNEEHVQEEQKPVPIKKDKPFTQKSPKWSSKKETNPDVIFGRDFMDDIVPVSDLVGEIGEVTIRGKVRKMDVRELRNEKFMVRFAVTDFTDTIGVKIFLKAEQKESVLNELKEGLFVKIKGMPVYSTYDRELEISNIVGIKKIADFTTKRMDTAERKRVELHCHTKMSDMDGTSEVKDLIKTAKSWGHKGIAITDHGVVQAFPDANHAVDPNDDFKVIYGVEGYFVDDHVSIVKNPYSCSFQETFIVFDLETTGFSSKKNNIIEIGAVKISNGKIVDRFSSYVNPREPIPFHIEKLTGIKDDTVAFAQPIEEVLPSFLDFCQDGIMVAHNSDFDMSFILHNCSKFAFHPPSKTVIDTVALARVLLPQLKKYKLDAVAKELRIQLTNHHRAVDDAECTALIFLKFIELLSEQSIVDLTQLNALCEATPDLIGKLPTYHGIILAKNDIGRVNLYTLISKSHLKYFHKRPRIPKSLIEKHREGLIIGSACEAGELFRALTLEKPEEEIARIVDFYDYLEIQPIGNNEFMLRSDRYSYETPDDLRAVNAHIVKLGETFQKPVVATCDVHFLNPEDEIYRRIIMTGKGFADADEQAPLYLHTTDEMLEEFSYLGTEKAIEVVIDNPNKILDSCEKISPVRPDKCPPVIPDSDQLLRNICYHKAHEMYGPNLPEVVTERLERELNSIISNGFAVMYIIAQKLVWKSNEDGYLVGSRGSVGSSFVATMAGITEVNPLSPHYHCPNCYYSDFDSALVKQYAGMSGCDMPDCECPVCNTKMLKDGFDIPFETFLGFKGNKEPDIDLNFSGDYQSKAHKYTEVIFGDGQTFRAGTIATLADKTAYGYVKKYYEERNVSKRGCEIERILEGCVGVRRSTGQHPGGIIVLPLGEDINSFTPVQHPANDMNTDIITTHFDYHSIDHNLLKLDILGHDDPTMIRMLEDLTGIDAKAIPFDEPNVMSLFRSTKALEIEPSDIGGCPLGTLGIPEFGTDFVIQMLQDTNPSSFSDLIRISGLSHGTDVWVGNAQLLIQEGKATISTAICTRDDIMTYLIGMGVESETAFTIMESVRKGKGLKPDWIEVMKQQNVPDWYIWSCQKIQYMFPKAHAAAYVMMAWRIAYCKVYYPLAYYAAYFSIRASSFNYELMCQGKEKLNFYMEDYKKRKDTLTQKEQDTLKDMRNVQEMYARGFEFHKLDLFRAKARRIQILDGKLMPPLCSLDGLGGAAAEAVEEAVKMGPFLSRDDFRQRTKVSKNTIELMNDLGLFPDLPESNQLSLFDF